MGTTYKAWDGNEYEWPPPKGWYQAIDNRWWAPGTGPEGAIEEQPATIDPNQPVIEDPTSLMSQETEVLNPAAIKPNIETQSDLPAWAKPSDLTGEQTTYIPDVNDFEPKSSSSDTTKILAGTMAAVAVILIAAVYFFVLRGGDDSSTATPATDPTTEPAENSQTTASTQIPTTTEENKASTSSTTSTTVATTQIVIETNVELLVQLEDELSEIGVAFDEDQGVENKENALQELAEGTCQDLSKATDSSDYARIKTVLINNQQTTNTEEDKENSLQRDQMEKTLDITVEIFCPEITEDF